MIRVNKLDYYNNHWQKDIKSSIIFISMMLLLTIVGSFHDACLFNSRGITIISIVVYIMRGIIICSSIYFLLWLISQKHKPINRNHYLYVFFWEIGIAVMCTFSDFTRPTTYYLSSVIEVPMLLAMYLIMPQYNNVLRIIPPILQSTFSMILYMLYKTPPTELGFGSFYMGMIFVNFIGIYFSQKMYSNEYHLFYLANIDPLTGLYNRRYFDNNLKRNWHICSKQKKNLTICLLDIDHFKTFNDTYGHQFGDRILSKTAAIIEQKSHLNNVSVARYGGEEFIITLADFSAKSGKTLAENIRKTIESVFFVANSQHHVKITISIGVSHIIPTSVTTPDLLIKQADTALYSAKSSGRNKTIVYDDN
ncbi:GGDEF domain-containing protein [Pectinatus frisingensis]|uniref:GGDEF domain-containing protein n=1 Tax=Pectinatus frisingensis TaxID=865 RepID=UPI0018C5A636|nr:GGDEF domain-containing protein [Pectinatus frisingensis]